jgi:FtsP/CotA-like multicopper oxidase with cupredoxin domain
MGAEQAQERQEMQNMREEMKDIKSTINDAVGGMSQLKAQQGAPQANVREMHLIAKSAACELLPGVSAECLTYNGKLPGPVIRVAEGDAVRIVLHNQLKTPTSLLFQGLTVPQSVGGLPRKAAGMVLPGQAFAYQFIAKQPGTYWYHPQITQSDQKTEGLSGVLIVEPRSQEKTYDRDIVAAFSDLNAVPASATASGAHYRAVPPGQSGHHYWLMNGKSAPAIPPMELKQGERVRLRAVNAGQQPITLYLSGHHFEVVACNGSDQLEPHTTRDTITLNPSDRYDLEFTANNPGVWSLASELYLQSTDDGKFPGGIACVVRYEQGADSDE